MIRKILRFYLEDLDFLYKFKGNDTKSGHMKHYLVWQSSMDIF